MIPQKRRVLLVEDSPTDALIVKHALRNRFDVEHARSAAEAQGLLDHGDFAAIVSDYCMPGMDGLGLQKWIAEKGLDLPVIIMSGHGDERVAAEAIKHGAYDYIVKSEESLSSMGVVIEQVLRRHALEQRTQVLQEIVENASDAIITLQTDGTIITLNRAAIGMFDVPADGCAGKPLAHLFPSEMNAANLERMMGSGAAGEQWQGELTASRKDGSQFPVHVSSSVMRDRRGAIRCLIAIARDVTERRQFLDRLKRLSITDNLTGLYNHRFFHERLQYEFIRARRYGNPLGCIMIDVDFFKSVNDMYGHLTGDEALKAIAERIARAVRTVDIAARYGGEEFAVLLPNTDLEGTVRCAEHVWETVGTTDIETRQGHLRLTISAGVAALTEQVHDEEELCRNADEALLAAKRRGRNNVCRWDELPPTEAPVPDEMECETSAHMLANLRRLVMPVKGRYLEALRPVMESLTRRQPQAQRAAANVAIFARELGRVVGMKEDELASLHNAALLGVIRNSATAGPDPQLTPETVVREMQVLEPERKYLRYRMERYDGNGPEGLHGEEIPLGARVLAVAETFNALMSGAEGQPALSEEEALAMLRKRGRVELDPDLIEKFASTRTQTTTKT